MGALEVLSPSFLLHLLSNLSIFFRCLSGFESSEEGKSTHHNRPNVSTNVQSRPNIYLRKKYSNHSIPGHYRMMSLLPGTIELKIYLFILVTFCVQNLYMKFWVARCLGIKWSLLKLHPTIPSKLNLFLQFQQKFYIIFNC